MHPRCLVIVPLPGHLTTVPGAVWFQLRHSFMAYAAKRSGYFNLALFAYGTLPRNEMGACGCVVLTNAMDSARLKNASLQPALSRKIIKQPNTISEFFKFS